MPVNNLRDWAGENSGLSPYKTGVGTQSADSILPALVKFIEKYQGAQKNKTFRDAVAREMGEDAGQLPSDYNYTNAYGDILKEKIKAKYSPQHKPQEDVGKQLVNLMGGVSGPEEVFNPEQIKQVAPKSLGPIVEGGEVLETPGQPGEYAPGYQPKPQGAAIAGMLRKKFGVTQDEAQRKALGLPQSKGLPQSYTDEFRTELQNASQRIQEGEDSKSVISELRQKYPGSFNMNVEYNLQQIGRKAKPQLNALRSQAVQALKESGYPVTENNIKSAIEQLRGQ